MEIKRKIMGLAVELQELNSWYEREKIIAFFSIMDTKSTFLFFLY